MLEAPFLQASLPGGREPGHGKHFAKLLRRQGLALDVRRIEPRANETVILLYDDATIASVDKDERVIIVTPADGLLE